MRGKDGLTATSANHLANIAKEMYEAMETRLEAVKFYNRDYMLAVNNNTYRVENESGKDELETMKDSLKEIGQLKSLIAYLREGIKAKTEKARYYALEARCSTIGKYIHPDGAFARARNLYFEHTKNPITVTGKGQDAELSAYSTSFTPEEVDGAFFALQKEYRTLQAEFNKMKGELDARVTERQKADASEKLAANKRWLDALALERVKYNEAVKAMKVKIPQNLKAIYEKVNAVASVK